MTEKQPTQKEWQRRALKAEAELEKIKAHRAHESVIQGRDWRIAAAASVAMKEIESAVAYFKEQP